MWTTPHDWTTGDKVTATRMNLIRDNLRFLYQPPCCRVGGVGSDTAVKTDAGLADWRVVDWPNTVADNDMMRTLTSGINPNEPAGGFLEVQTAGRYLATTVISFDIVTVDTGMPAGPYSGLSHTLAVAVRNGPAGGAAYTGLASDGYGGGQPPTVRAAGAYSCLGGYQWFIHLYQPSEQAGKQTLIRAGAIPFLNVTWIGPA